MQNVTLCGAQSVSGGGEETSRHLSLLPSKPKTLLSCSAFSLVRADIQTRMAAENKEARLALARQLVDDLVDAAERKVLRAREAVRQRDEHDRLLLELRQRDSVRAECAHELEDIMLVARSCEADVSAEIARVEAEQAQRERIAEEERERVAWLAFWHSKAHQAGNHHRSPASSGARSVNQTSVNQTLNQTCLPPIGVSRRVGAGGGLRSPRVVMPGAGTPRVTPRRTSTEATLTPRTPRIPAHVTARASPRGVAPTPPRLPRAASGTPPASARGLQTAKPVHLSAQVSFPV